MAVLVMQPLTIMAFPFPPARSDGEKVPGRADEGVRIPMAETD
jgi:hypothetical protein